MADQTLCGKTPTLKAAYAQLGSQSPEVTLKSEGKGRVLFQAGDLENLVLEGETIPLQHPKEGHTRRTELQLPESVYTISPEPDRREFNSSNFTIRPFTDELPVPSKCP